MTKSLVCFRSVDALNNKLFNESINTNIDSSIITFIRFFLITGALINMHLMALYSIYIDAQGSSCSVSMGVEIYLRN
jgi:hypothetical protein